MRFGGDFVGANIVVNEGVMTGYSELISDFRFQI